MTMAEIRYRETRAGEREARRLAALAYERALHVAISDLDAAFEAWRHGKMTAVDVNDSIHEYHQSAQREAWGKFVQSKPAIAIARAVAEGFLREGDLSPRLLEDLRPAIDFFCEQS